MSSRIHRVTGVLAALVVMLSCLCAPTVSQAAVGDPTFANQLVEDAADPTIEFWRGNYYMSYTTWDNRVVMRKSPVLAGLRTATPVTVWSDTEPSRSANMWAPDLRRLQGTDGRMHWYLMYTMGRPGTFGEQHLHVLESAGDDPMGPYRYRGRPIPTDQWNIDGSYLQLGGELFAIWSMFAPDGLQSNYIARMSNPWTVSGSMNLLSQPTQDWERIGQPVNEGPVQLTRGGSTYIVYSASFCGTDDYRLGTLRYLGGDPATSSSWQKSTGPVFTKNTTGGAFGPGHNDFFTSPDGSQTWNLYHANPASGQGCARARTARAQQVTFNGETPSFGTPAALGAALAVPSGERGPITTDVPGATWELVNRNSGLCAATAGASAANGGDVVQTSCGASGASWVLDSTADGNYRLVNALSDKAMDAQNCGGSDGTNVQQWAWLANACQQWRITSGNGGWLTFTGVASGKVLDVASCSGAVGGDVRLWSSAGNACQQWMLRPVGDVAVVSSANGKSFDLPGCSTSDGALLQQHQWLDSACQRYRFTAVGSGVQVHPVSSPSQCLAVRAASGADGADVVQTGCTAPGSTWRLEPQADGAMQITAAHSGKVLDVADCGAGDGVRLRQWSDLDNACQRFRVAAAS